MIFIDTAAFISRYLKHDQYHLKGLEFWKELETLKERLFTTNFVINETITLLARRESYAFAAQRAKIFYGSQTLTVLRATEEDENNALHLFEKFEDQHVGFTDCISFVLMRKNHLEKVFTFDQHFKFAGFEIVPTL